jgi:hypothetical protein
LIGPGLLGDLPMIYVVGLDPGSARLHKMWGGSECIEILASCGLQSVVPLISNDPTYQALSDDVGHYRHFV